MSAPANQQQPFSSSPIAGTVLPIRRAEELLATLPGVIAARIVASESGTVDEIHVLTTSEVAPKQTVRNVESALIAHLGMRVDHRKISVATTIEPPKVREAREAAIVSGERQQAREAVREHASAGAGAEATPGTAAGFASGGGAAVAAGEGAKSPSGSRGEAAAARAEPRGETARRPAAETVRDERSAPASSARAVESGEVGSLEGRETDVSPLEEGRAGAGRNLLFDAVEVRRSREGEVTYRVTLRKGAESYIGESGGFENERSRVEHVARAALEAIRGAEGDDRHLSLEGCRVVEAFDRQFAFAGVSAREGREAALLTGSCEIRESPETSAVLAVLDATNRWIARSE